MRTCGLSDAAAAEAAFELSVVRRGQKLFFDRAPPCRLTSMITTEWLAALARYNRWMNDKLYTLAQRLSDEERKQDDRAFFRSIHGTFNHILLADTVWFSRFERVPAPDGFMAPGIRSLDEELYADFDELRVQHKIMDQKLSAWVASLDTERLQEPLVYMRRGQKVETPLWWAVAHLFNHQTHHRGQITTLFNQKGLDPGVTDLYAMLRDEQSAASSA